MYRQGDDGPYEEHAKFTSKYVHATRAGMKPFNSP